MRQRQFFGESAVKTLQNAGFSDMVFRLTASVLAIGIGSAANAGGYVVPIVQFDIADPVPVQPFSWTGPYIGAQAGHTKMRVKSHPLVRGPDQVIYHPEESVVEIVEHPAITKDVEHPAVTEDRTTTTEHPAETVEVEHPAVTEDRVRTVDHPAVVEAVQVGEEKLWVPTAPEDQFGGCHHGNNTCPVPDPTSPSGWKYVAVYEDRTVSEAWSETVHETVTISEAWTETVIVKPAYTETTTETVIVKPAYTETKVVEPARTETRKVTKPAWTEVISGAWVVDELHSINDSANTFGLFAGYRYQTGSKIVLGAEYNYLASKNVVVKDFGNLDLDTHSIEAQAGYAIARWLPYVAAGVAKTDRNTGWLAAAGVDYAITERIIVGAKYTHYDYGSIAPRTTAVQDTAALRVGFRF